VTAGLSTTGAAASPTAGTASAGGPLGRAQSWLDHEYFVSDEQLGFLRVLYCAFVLFVIGLPTFTWIAKTPQLLFDPPLLSPADLLSGWPSYGFLWTLSFALVVCFLLLLLGFFVATVSVLTSVLLIVGSNLQFSFGKIDHHILLALGPLVMAGSGWGNRFTLARGRAAPNRSGVCLGLFAIVVGFAMFTAGFQKLVTGWLDPRTQASYGHLIQNFYGTSSGVLLAPFAMHVRSKFVWEGLDWATVGFELLFLAAVIRRTWFRAWIVLAVFFHTGTLLVLDIGFAVNFSAYLLFADWPVPRFRLSRRSAWLVAGCACVVALSFWWQTTAPNQQVQMGSSLAGYVVNRAVGPANVNGTTDEILPDILALLAVAGFLIRRSRNPGPGVMVSA
jgi:hypothetical protein